MITSRRKFLIGMGSMLAAPAIVHAGNIMPVKAIPFELPTYGISPGMAALRALQYLDELNQKMLLSLPLDAYTIAQRPTHADVKFVPMPWAAYR